MVEREDNNVPKSGDRGHDVKEMEKKKITRPPIINLEIYTDYQDPHICVRDERF